MTTYEHCWPSLASQYRRAKWRIRNCRCKQMLEWQAPMSFSDVKCQHRWKWKMQMTMQVTAANSKSKRKLQIADARGDGNWQLKIHTNEECKWQIQRQLQGANADDSGKCPMQVRTKTTERALFKNVGIHIHQSDGLQCILWSTEHVPWSIKHVSPSTVCSIVDTS